MRDEAKYDEEGVTRREFICGWAYGSCCICVMWDDRDVKGCVERCERVCRAM